MCYHNFSNVKIAVNQINMGSLGYLSPLQYQEIQASKCHLTLVFQTWKTQKSNKHFMCMCISGEPWGLIEKQDRETRNIGGLLETITKNVVIFFGVRCI